MNLPRFLPACAIAGFAVFAFAAFPVAALADADEGVSANAASLGLQPIRGAVPVATPAPGESSVFQRSDGAYQEIGRAHV